MNESFALCLSLVVLLALPQYGISTAGLGESRDSYGVLDDTVKPYLIARMPLTGMSVDEWLKMATPTHILVCGRTYRRTYRRRIHKKSDRSPPPVWLQTIILRVLLVGLCGYYCRCLQARRLYHRIVQYLHTVPLTRLLTSAGYSALVIEMLLMIAGDVEPNPGPTILTMKNFKEVYSAVYAVRSKWWNLGVALDIPMDDLEAIEARQDIDRRLQEVLTMWLRRTSLNPSWETLVSALRSKIVDRSDIANEIVLHQHLPTEQSNSLSLPPPHNVFPTYQSDSLTLRNPQNVLTLYANYLKSVYTCTGSEFPDYGKWPRTQSTCYTALASISKEGIKKEEEEEIKRSTLYGDVDRVFKSKEPIEMKDILQATETGAKPKCVLMEGGPGVGKTTFSWEVCREWGKGQLFQEYSIAVFLPLRSVNVQQVTKVADFFRHDDEQKQMQIASDIIEAQGKDTLIILDGLDELPANLLSQDSIFGRLLSGTTLPLATILVTSRPSVIGKVLSEWEKKISRHIEILGFTKQSIDDYSKSVMSPEDLPDFMKYLFMHPHIHTMMYVPLNSVIVTEIYNYNKHSNKPTPTTATQLYTDFSHTVLQRYLRSQPQYKDKEWNLDQFSDLPPPVYADFQKLCEIAYDGTMAMELQVTFNKLGISFQHLGFMHTSRDMYGPRGVSESYTFLHFSIQEYLAAVHMSQFEKQKQRELCHDALRNSHHGTSNVIKYFFGLTKADSIDPSYKISRNISDNTELLYEAQNPELLSSLGQSLENVVSVYMFLEPRNCVGLVYCITHSKCSWDLEIIAMDSEEAEEFSRGLSACNPSRAGCICALNWTGTTQYLNEIPQHILQGIGNLELSSSDDYLLAETLSCMCNLNALRLDGLTLSLDAALAFFNKLTTCKELVMEHCKISYNEESRLRYVDKELTTTLPPEGIVLLSMVLCASNSIVDKLTIYAESLDLQSANAITTMVRCQSLTELNIESDLYTMDCDLTTAQHLARGLQWSKTHLGKVRLMGITFPLDATEDIYGLMGCTQHFVAIGYCKVRTTQSTTHQFELQYALETKTLTATLPPEGTVLLSKGVCTNNFIVDKLTLTAWSLDLQYANAITVMMECQSLNELSIDCSLHSNPTAARHLARWLQQNKTHLGKVCLKGITFPMDIIEDVFELMACKTLSLEHCTVKSIRGTTTQLGLQYDPETKKLTATLSPEEIKEVKVPSTCTLPCTVQELTVTTSTFDSVSAKAIAALLVNFQSMTKLSIFATETNPAAAQELVRGFNKNRALTTFNMYTIRGSVGVTGAIAISEALEHTRIAPIENLSVSSERSSVRLSNQCLSCSELQHIVLLAKALATNTTLTEVKIVDCTIGDEGAIRLAEGLRINVTLHRLHVSDSSIGDKGAKAIADSLACNTTLQQLIMSPNHIGSSGVLAITKSFCRPEALRSLLSINTVVGVRNNLLNINIKGCLTDSRYLLTATDYHRISCEGIVLLSRVLSMNIPIKAVRLCSFDPASTQTFATVLKETQGVTILSIETADIWNDEVQQLAYGLQSNTSLQVLGIDFIGNTGALAIAKSLDDNQTLQGVRISGKLEQSGAIAVVNSFLHSRSLQILCLSIYTVVESMPLELKLTLSKSTQPNISLGIHSPERTKVQLKCEIRETKIQSLSLQSGVSLDILFSVLKHPSVTELNLIWELNDFNSWNAQILTDILQEGQFLIGLKLQLKLQTTAKTCEADKVVQSLAEGLHCSATLQEVNVKLSTNTNAYLSVGDRATAAMAKAVQHSKTLKVLRMCDVQVSPSTVLDLMESFKHTNKLEVLNITAKTSANAIDLEINRPHSLLTVKMRVPLLLFKRLLIDDDISFLSSILSSCTWIRELNIVNCAVKSKDFVSFLTSNQSLTKANCRFEVNGVHQLAESLQDSVALQEFTCKLFRKGLISISDQRKISAILTLPRSPTILYIEGCGIGDDDTLHLAAALKCNVTLKELHMAWNKVGYKGAAELADALHHNSTLKVLDLSGNNVGWEGILALASVSGHSKTLQQLHFDTFSFGQDHASILILISSKSLTADLWDYEQNALAVATSNLLKIMHKVSISSFECRQCPIECLREFFKCDTLRTCTLVDNHFDSTSAHAFATMLKVNQNLTRLDLKGPYFSPWGVVLDEEVYVHLAEGISHNNKLKVLNISCGRYGPRSMQAFAAMLRTNQTLTTLIIEDIRLGEGIGSTGMQHLAEGLQHNTTVQKLIVSSNEIGNIGAIAIADVLRHNHTLQSIDISRNLVEDRGAAAIAESLVHNTTLTELNMSENIVQDIGAISMAEMLKVNTSLKQLNMYTSKTCFCIGLRGTEALVDCLQHNPHLERLTLSDKFYEYLQTETAYPQHKHRIELRPW